MGNAFRSVLSSGGGGGGDNNSIILSCDSSFAGETVTCTNGTTTYTKTCPSASPYTVTFDGLAEGTWTITCLTSTVQVVVKDIYTTQFNVIPVGKTATPVDNVQTWLHCANIFDKAYTTVSQVLTDSEVVAALVISDNAVDYMIRSTGFASTIASDATALGAIKTDDGYCLDEILSDATWLDAICNGNYMEILLDVKVPTMTSNTTPSGEAYSSSVWKTGYEAYKAFDNNDSTSWTASQGENHYVQYHFTQAVNVKNVTLKSDYLSGFYGLNTFKIQASNDNSTWDDLTETLTNANPANAFDVRLPDNDDYYTYYRLYVFTTTAARPIDKFCGATTVQFYGRVQSV